MKKPAALTRTAKNLRLMCGKPFAKEEVWREGESSTGTLDWNTSTTKVWQRAGEVNSGKGQQRGIMPKKKGKRGDEGRRLKG